MKRAIDETNRRREKQIAHNLLNNITPKGIRKSVQDIMETSVVPGAGSRAARNRAAVAEKQGKYAVNIDPKNLWKSIELLEKQMFQAAKDLEFEVAGKLRDQIEHLKKKAL